MESNCLESRSLEDDDVIMTNYTHVSITHNSTNTVYKNYITCLKKR